MKSLRSLALSSFIGLAALAPQALAQSAPTRQITPPKLTKVPAVKNEELQVIPPNTPITGIKIVNPALQLVTMEPPPETHSEGVSCHTISITSLAFQFSCVRIILLPDEYYSTSYSKWVIRRDGTQPSWALKAEDFEHIKEIVSKDKYGRLNHGNQFTGEFYERFFNTAEGLNPPGKYCTSNPMRASASSNRSCYDLMSIWYSSPKED